MVFVGAKCTRLDIVDYGRGDKGRKSGLGFLYDNRFCHEYTQWGYRLSGVFFWYRHKALPADGGTPPRSATEMKEQRKVGKR